MTDQRTRQKFADRTDLRSALTAHGARLRAILARAVGLTFGFTVLLWFLLGTLSPKRAGAYTWLAFMTIVFFSAIHLGRRAERSLEETRPRCSACDADLSGNWSDQAVDSGNCPVCTEPLF